MEEINYQEIANTRYTDRFAQDPVFVAIMETLISFKEQRQREYLNLATEFLDVEIATGKNLDLIGNLLGEPRELVNFINRPYFGFYGARLAESFNVGEWYSLYKNKYGSLKVLTDDEYRRVIKARIIKNSSHSTRDDLVNVVNILTGNTSAILKEEQQGVVTLYLEDEDGLASYYLSKYKQDRDIIPLPLGFRLNITYEDERNFLYLDGTWYLDGSEQLNGNKSL